jgi:hypothetical protein
LAEAEGRGLAPATLKNLSHIFETQLLDFCSEEDIQFLSDLNARNLTEWRSAWQGKSQEV